MPPAQQLGDHAAHGVTHGNKPADTEGLRQRGDVVGAILQPEPRAGVDPVAVAAQVGGNDTEMAPERYEDLSPVQLSRHRYPVDEYDRLGAARARALPHPRDPAAGQFHQACRGGLRRFPEHSPDHCHAPALPVSGASDRRPANDLPELCGM